MHDIFIKNRDLAPESYFPALGSAPFTFSRALHHTNHMVPSPQLFSLQPLFGVVASRALSMAVVVRDIFPPNLVLLFRSLLCSTFHLVDPFKYHVYKQFRYSLIETSFKTAIVYLIACRNNMTFNCLF